jgi:GT2 family glycosyltransferase
MACIESVKQRTSYQNYEIIVVGNQDLDPVTKQHLLSGKHTIISVEGSLNISRLLNHGATQAAGTYLLLLSENTEVISPDWMTSMLGFCRLSGIGAVGAKLLYRTGCLQHIGVVLGLKGLTGHPLRGFQGFSDTHMDPSDLIRNCSAVTGACMMVRKYVFDRFDGFDEQLPNAYNDIDFCLRLRQAGYRIAWTPDALLYHDEPTSPSSTDGRDAKYFKKRWDKDLKNDPYYNPNLTLQYEDLGYRV